MEPNKNVEDAEQLLDQNQQGNAGNGADGEEPEEKRFTQEEVDKIVEKRLNRERKKLAAAMGPGDPREIELSEREQAVAKKELQIEAAETFRKEHLPEEALELLNYTDKESCEQSIDLVRKVFQMNVQDEVNRRLKGGKPLKLAPSTAGEELRRAFGL